MARGESYQPVSHGDLEGFEGSADVFSGSFRGLRRLGSGGRRGASTVEYLVTRKELSPTDYALAWALTYYLANKRFEPFLDYLKEMSEAVPLEPRTEAEHLADVSEAFPREPQEDGSVDRPVSGGSARGMRRCRTTR